MKHFCFILLIICLSQQEFFAQTCFYQDVLNGGVISIGHTPGTDLNPSGTFKIPQLPINSQIKKGFLFGGRFGEAKKIDIIFNGYNLQFNSFNQVSENFICSKYGGYSGVHCIDVTNLLNTNDTLINFISEENQPFSKNKYSDFWLILIFENPFFNKCSVSTFLNNKSLDQIIQQFSINNIMPILTTDDVALSIYSSYLCDTTKDGNFVFIDSNPAGLIGGNIENLNNCGGPIGNFSYYNGNSIGINGHYISNVAEGYNSMLNFQNYIINHASFINVDFSYQSPNWPNGIGTNAIWSCVLAYTTPCDTFSASVSRDTIICAGQALPLQASGGMRYEWLPQIFLSCYDCPNPVFVGDSTITYTVRIWNNDSCSKVLPLRVVVRPAPVVHAYSLVPPICGTATGQIQVTQASGGQPPYSYALQPGNLSSSTGIFANLSAGTYALSVTDALGCSSSQNITLPDTNNVQALFTANPEQGVAPLNVWFLNQSQNAQNYQWLIDGQSYSTQDAQYLFSQNGTYDVQLIATGAAAYCTDTFTLQVLVYEQLAVVLYNIFTPNADGSNDEFGCSVNVPCQISCRIYNRWGNLLSHQEIETATTGFIPLWDGANASGGVYFYEMEFLQPFGKKQVFKGTVTLVR